MIGFAVDGYRDLLRALAGAAPADEHLHAEIARAAASGRFDRVDVAALPTDALRLSIMSIAMRISRRLSSAGSTTWLKSLASFRSK